VDLNYEGEIGPEDAPHVFTLTKPGGFVQKYGVHIGYYKADQGDDGYKDSSNTPAGAYEMKVARHFRWQLPYSKAANHTSHRGKLVNQCELIFDKEAVNDTLDSYKVVLRARTSPYTRDLVEFQVELNGIPVMGDKQGKEVIVNWKMLDGNHGRFNASNVFFTDSNGLEMQRRELNHRPTWNFSDAERIQNISQNYYPVQNAIVMRDWSTNPGTVRQVVVMNERSQAASANLIAGNIEFNQNRRLLHDDNKGVMEPLNETDKDGYGMKVNARYWLQILDYHPHIHGANRTTSLQRQQQLVIDQPLQYFFSFNYTVKNATRQHHDYIVDLDGANFTTGKVITFPLAKNSILARFENVDDRFDWFGHSTAVRGLWVDIERCAHEFYNEANPDTWHNHQKPFIMITEVGLTNNMGIHEAEKRRSDAHHWKAEDDDTVDFSHI